MKLKFLWLLLAAAAVQGIVIFVGLNGAGAPMGDVAYVYDPWMQELQKSNAWWGLNRVWVYPYLALVPMVLSLPLRITDYQSGWLVMMTLLNVVALASMVGWGRHAKLEPDQVRWRYQAAWYFLGFELLLGPVAISRVDAVSVAVVLFAIPSLIAMRYQTAAVWFTVATWIKVWPAALLLALWVAARKRLNVIFAAVVTSLAVVLFALALGGNRSVFSFVTMQGTRGIQIESPWATPWLWAAIAGAPETGLYYDQQLLTYQVRGTGVEVVAALSTLVLVGAILITAYLAMVARRRRASAGAVLSVTALTAVLDLIFFNKVGSPQYIEWLAIPIIFGILLNRRGWMFPAITGLVLAGLTQLIYPITYGALLEATPWATALLGIRNLTLLALLVWANLQLSNLKSPESVVEKLAD